MVSVDIIFKWDVYCNFKVTKGSSQRYEKLYLWWANEYVFPYFLRINTYLLYCAVFKFYFNLHIVHVPEKLFQNNIVRAAEIFPSRGICFFELPEVWCRLTIAEKGWSCSLWRVIWKFYFIWRDLKRNNRNCYSSVSVTSFKAILKLKKENQIKQSYVYNTGTITVIHHSPVEFGIIL